MTGPEFYLAPTRDATTFRARARSRNVVVCESLPGSPACPPDRVPLVGKEVRGTSIQDNTPTAVKTVIY